MVDQQVTTFFNEIYDRTYGKAMKYVTLKCSKNDDIADILQEIYMEAYSVILKKGTDYIKNEDAFILRLAKFKVYRHYTVVEKLLKILPLYIRNDDGEDIDLPIIEEEICIEDKLISKETIDQVWDCIRYKPMDIQKIFYLYYYSDMSLSEIASELRMNESNVKHKLYRTLREVRSIFQKEGM